MKISTTLLAAGLLPFITAETIQSTRMLRGKPIVHTRTVKKSEVNEEDGSRQQGLRAAEKLVDPHSDPNHHYAKVRGKNSQGERKAVVLDLNQLEDKLPHDAAILTQNHNHFQHDEGAATHNTHIHHGHRLDHQLHHDAHASHFERHEQVEQHHQHKYHQHNNTEGEDHGNNDGNSESKRDRSMYALPTGLESHFNQTLFNNLHNAPFKIYEEAIGRRPETDSFPVFVLPEWHHLTGVFTGFSRKADPLIFENTQFLLEFEDMVAASNGVDEELADFIENNNFHSSLIIGKSIGNGASVPFIGMVVSYYQHGSQKNVLVPLSKLEDFFDDVSEKHLLNPTTKDLEVAALHDLLEQKRSNSSSFYHPALAHTEERKAQLEKLEIVHFQKLFQLLIRRSYLFSFGYADCLLHEPSALRQCLDDNFYNLIKLETGVRGALDDQVVQQLAEINDSFHGKVSEACINTQGSGTGIMYGSGSCYHVHDLSAFIGGYGTI